MRTVLALACLLAITAPRTAFGRQVSGPAPEPSADSAASGCGIWVVRECIGRDGGLSMLSPNGGTVTLGAVDRRGGHPALSLDFPSAPPRKCPDEATLAGSLCELRQMATLPYGLDLSGPLAPAVGVMVRSLVPSAAQWETMRAWPVAPSVSYRHRTLRVALTVGI